MDRSVLVLGETRQTVSVVRSLARSGYRVVLGQTGIHPSSAGFSKATHEIWKLPGLADAELFEGAIATIANERKVEVIFPVGDEEVAFFAARPGLVSPPVIVAMPEPDVAALCQDKNRMGSVVVALGIPYAETACVATRQQLTEAVGKIGFPCVIKPNDPQERSALKEKAIICTSRDGFDRTVEAWPQDLGQLLVQRFVDGPRQNISFAAENGRVVGLVQLEVLRTNRLDGTGLLAEGVTVPMMPELFNYCQALTDHLRYTGVGNLQFLVSRTGDITFLELNPRLDANWMFAEYCGLDLAVLAVRLAGRQPVGQPPPPGQYRSGVRLASTIGDLGKLAKAARDRSITPSQGGRWLWQALVAMLRADIHIVWSWRDPVPTLARLHLASPKLFKLPSGADLSPPAGRRPLTEQSAQ